MAERKSTKLRRLRDRLARIAEKTAREEGLEVVEVSTGIHRGEVAVFVRTPTKRRKDPPFELDLTSSVHQDPVEMGPLLIEMRGYPWQPN